MGKWKAEYVILVLSLLFAAFVGGYFAGRNTVAPAATIVTTQLSPPEQLEQPKPEAPQQESSDQKEPNAALLDLNTATAEEFQQLPGIGQELAQRIVEYRQEYGRFTSIEELTEVSGIGDGKLDAVRDLVTVR